MKLVHLTTVHPRHDSRIFVKQVKTLSAAYGSVCLMVADGKGMAVDGDVQIVDLGKIAGGRLKRFFIGTWRAFFSLRRMDAEIVHFHDPELIFLAVLLRIFGVKIIYDVHEDLPRQILDKPYLAKVIRRPIASLAGWVEWLAGRVVNGVVAATPTIGARFPDKKTVLVRNFPILDEFAKLDTQIQSLDKNEDKIFAYVGGLVVSRGAKEMVGAIGQCADESACLMIGGTFSDPELRRDLEALPEWRRVKYLGWLDREGVSELLANACGGVVVLHPTPSYVQSLPIKLFEYMASGLPVIASDFDLWRSIVKDAQCGLLVDPLDVTAISKAMDWILANPMDAIAMGARGRAAVEKKYNWGPEGDTLIELYRTLGALPEGNKKQ